MADDLDTAEWLRQMREHYGDRDTLRSPGPVYSDNPWALPPAPPKYEARSYDPQVDRPRDWSERSGVGEGAGLAPLRAGAGLGELLGRMRQAITDRDWSTVSDVSPFALGAVAMGKKGATPAPAVSKVAPPPTGRFFDMSRLHEVPDVPQTPLPRYEPPRGVPERTADLVSNKTVQRKLGDIMDRGAIEGGARWYGTEPLRKSFVDELGPKEGIEAFRSYMDYVAATSPRSRVPDNIRNASFYYARDRQGLPMPEVGTPNPAPYGHLAQRLHQGNAANVAESGGWDVMKNPKPASFAENLSGNQMPGTIDAHATNLPAMLAQDPRFLATSVREPDGKGGWNNLSPQKMFKSGELTMKEALDRPPYWAGIPNSTEYAALEKMYADLAAKRGLTTAGGQASAWLEGGKTTGLGSPAEPWMKSFEDVLLRTAEKNGETPTQTLKRFIQGKGTLYGAGGAGVGAAASRTPDEPDQQ